MPKEVMRRQASDNAYLHKDFHGALSGGLEYIQDRYGEQAVRDYLRQFALSYYAPLREQLREKGLEALKQHIERTYVIEGGAPRITGGPDELRVEVDACPAVQHMRAHGYPVARMWHETTKAVNEAICEGSPFAAELVSYDPQSGASVQRFYRRRP